MKKISIAIFCVLSFAAYLMSCSDMNELHDSFMEDGEKIYAARLDSVIAASGKNRVQLTMQALSQRINKVRIYWNDKSDSIDVPINNQTGVFNQIISDLNEGEYIFQFVSFDDYGNKSLKGEVSCQAFGDLYSAGLINRKIEKMEYVETDLVITWRSFANALGSELIYENAENGTSSVFVKPAETRTVISNYKNDGHYTIQSGYLPTANAIDTFKTTITEGFFPHYIRYTVCDKSLFAAMSLPNDMGRLGWDNNERMERLWDGSVGPQGYPWIFHGTSSRGVITFDLGRSYENLGLVEETGRDCCGNPLVFEIWGTDDISGAETELSAVDAGWPDEMMSKGWTLLKEVVRTDDGKAPYKTELNDNLPAVRYIRIRFKETVENQAANLSEVTFWYKE